MKTKRRLFRKWKKGHRQSHLCIHIAKVLLQRVSLLSQFWERDLEGHMGLSPSFLKEQPPLHLAHVVIVVRFKSRTTEKTAIVWWYMLFWGKETSKPHRINGWCFGEKSQQHISGTSFIFGEKKEEATHGLHPVGIWSHSEECECLRSRPQERRFIYAQRVVCARSNTADVRRTPTWTRAQNRSIFP